jgi:hypothetical protein
MRMFARMNPGGFGREPRASRAVIGKAVAHGHTAGEEIALRDGKVLALLRVDGFLGRA